jgi:hypothetical protein
MLRQTVLFEGTDASGHAGLWETNGTADGTYELTGVPNGVFSPADFTVFNNEVLFQGQDTSLLYGIWETNGTAAGTTEICLSMAPSALSERQLEPCKLFNRRRHCLQRGRIAV